MAAEVLIGGRRVGDNHPTFVIAELGINANGDVDEAKKLIDTAIKCGADAVKFQKRTVSSVFTKAELDKPREVPRWLLEKAIERGVLPEENRCRLLETDFKDTRNGDQKYALEFTNNEFSDIDHYCSQKGIMWSASPWDEESVDFLDQHGVPFYKIASASVTDDGLLRHIRRKGRPIIMSTGACTHEMVLHAVEVLGQQDLVILQCTAAYPQAGSEEVLATMNLDYILTLKREYPGVPIGFSGNDPDRRPTELAIGKGATVIEKHLTLNRIKWGSDQASSTEPQDFKEIVDTARIHDRARGDGVKRIYPAEEAVMKKLRRK
jgi:N-acetylneuraminate synthase